MRDRILARHATIMPFESPWAVNQMTYAAEPDIFGLRAHLYAQERGGMAFIREIFENEVEFGTGERAISAPGGKGAPDATAEMLPIWQRIGPAPSGFLRPRSL